MRSEGCAPVDVSSLLYDHSICVMNYSICLLPRWVLFPPEYARRLAPVQIQNPRINNPGHRLNTANAAVCSYQVTVRTNTSTSSHPSRIMLRHHLITRALPPTRPRPPQPHRPTPLRIQLRTPIHTPLASLPPSNHPSIHEPPSQKRRPQQPQTPPQSTTPNSSPSKK